MSGTLAEGRGDLGVRLAPAAVAVSEVGHSEDAGQQRDGLALQPLKVAGAVVIFAVIPHGLGHPVYDLEFLNDAAAPLYIGLVELVLLLGDVPLQYHIIGQAHGAYFVQQARIVAVPAGGLIGTFIGAIPGAGGDIAVFVSYGASKSASKHPELYGTGIPNGVAATESANNGCSGGAMIPLLSLGVPGDSVTAILLGAFIMKGITPGPMMYVTELPTVYRVFAALMLANLCMLVVGCLGVRFFAKIVSIEKKMLYPIILVISLLGAFSINKNAFDVGVCVAFGIIGWLMNKYEFPLSPILLALILGPMCEKNFVRYMNIQRGNFFAITTSPIAMVFATVAILVIVYSVYNQSKINKRAAANAAQEKA